MTLKEFRLELLARQRSPLPDCRVAEGYYVERIACLDAAISDLGALERSGLDICHCIRCFKYVVCLPDGMPLCANCEQDDWKQNNGSGAR